MKVEKRTRNNRATPKRREEDMASCQLCWTSRNDCSIHLHLPEVQGPSADLNWRTQRPFGRQLVVGSRGGKEKRNDRPVERYQTGKGEGTILRRIIQKPRPAFQCDSAECVVRDGGWKTRTDNQCTFRETRGILAFVVIPNGAPNMGRPSNPNNAINQIR